MQLKTQHQNKRTAWSSILRIVLAGRKAGGDADQQFPVRKRSMPSLVTKLYGMDDAIAPLV